MNYKNMLKHAGMLCEYDDLTRDTSNDYAILDELKKLKDTYLGDDFYWWDGTSDGKTSKDEPLGYWDGRDGTSHYYIRTRYGTQFSIVVDTKQNIIIRVFLGNKCYATYNSIDEFEEYLKKRNNARKQKKSISEYDEDQDEWISGAHENESTKIKNKNMTINEAKQLLKKNGYIINEEAESLSDLYSLECDGKDLSFIWVTYDYLTRYKELTGPIPGDGKLVLLKDVERVINQLQDIIKQKDQEIAELSE